MRRRLWDAPVWRARRARLAGDDEGYTLIEVLVALTIITVGLLATLFALSTDVKAQGTEKGQTNGIHLASSALESAAAQPYTTAGLCSWQPTSPQVVGSVSYTVTRTITGNCASGTSTSVAVTVQWTTGRLTRTVNMSRSYSDTTAKTTAITPLTFMSCSISPVGTLGGLVTKLQLLSVQTFPAQNETVKCVTTGLTTADSVSLAYDSITGSLNATLPLASTDGTTWTATLTTAKRLENTSLLASLPIVASLIGVTEHLKFTATRVLDGKTFSSSLAYPLEAVL